MRDFRLGRTVDVITCLGNSLAYIQPGEDLAAVFATFAAHAKPGTLVAISTLLDPVLAAPRTHRIDTADLHGEVTISYEWDARERVNTMRRVWRLDTGETEVDVIRRSVLSGDILAGEARRSHFRSVHGVAGLVGLVAVAVPDWT